MLGDLVVKNVGPLVDVKISGKKILILIGPQSTGKSIIAKLFSIFKSFDFLEQRISFDEAIRNHAIHLFIASDSFIRYENDKFSFEYSNNSGNLVFNESWDFKEVSKRILTNKEILDESKSLMLRREELISASKESIEKIKPGGNETNEEGKNEIEIENEIYKGRVESNLEEISRIGEELDRLFKVVESNLEKFKAFSPFSYYIPAERNLISILSSAFFSLAKNDINLPKNFIEFANNYESARNLIGDLELDFLDNFSYKRTNDEDYIHIKNVDKLVKLTNSSSGFQTMIPLLLVLEYAERILIGTQTGKTFVIEEPELNLFPETQYALLRYINRKYLQETNNDIVITTHSPYTLSSFNNLLLSHRIKEMGSDISNSLGWVDSSSFGSYYVNNGVVKSILDENTKMISSNELDSASEYILNDNDFLMNGLKNILNAKSN